MFQTFIAEDVCSGKCTGSDVYCQPSADSTSFTCVCKLGYRYDSGSDTCKDVDECAENLHDCDESFRASCTNTDGSYSCQCKAPLYEGNGHLCNKVDDPICKRKCPDKDKQYCLHTIFRTPFGHFDADSCICQTGYKITHSGCVDCDECDELCKGKNSICENKSPGYICKCKPGFEGNGVHCQDVNECLTNNGGCDVNADCLNTDGSYSCKCKYGYAGDGVTCSALCDVDECATEGPTLCPSDALCVNTVGSYYCRCKVGYELNKEGTACIDIDECERGENACAESWMADCINQPGTYRCRCKAEFDGDGHYCGMYDSDGCSLSCGSPPEQYFCYDIIFGPIHKEACLCQYGYMATVTGCEDVDECTDDPYPCHPNADCKNIPASFFCRCKAGYEGDGYHCRDVDECAPGGNNTCSQHTDCINTDGSYKCVCQYGYTGDGATCTPICPGPTKPQSEYGVVEMITLVSSTQNAFVAQPFCRNCALVSAATSRATPCTDDSRSSKPTAYRVLPVSKTYDFRCRERLG
ncbi:hypothetical protein NP493_204g12032 [Ridgeia piscesae]|uniref:EGF-like domain-containing protein n=1 Tax=Ridgeia piscesae TaxID=27915 RepID=A0AAD9P0T6_RIDPI|nr:hypothetical protein NP493_204g12032 [Ridgeia piscesae]